MQKGCILYTDSITFLRKKVNIKELIKRARDNGEDITSELRQKSISVPPWSQLVKAYDPTLHPVMDQTAYPDVTHYEERVSDTIVDDFGNPKTIKVPVGAPTKVTRVTYDLQRLAVKRTTELCFGIPVKRNYRPQNERQQEIAKYLEAIFNRARIDSVNIDRGRKLFASCEIVTIWYGVEQPNNIYGFDSKLKLRCVTYSPMQGDDLYPLFDETGDLVALSIAYKRKVKDREESFFDTYTAEEHIRWSTEDPDGGDNQRMKIVEDEQIKTGKIPGIYIYRPTPAWEDGSPLVYEMEWAVSRNGNYLRENSRPILMAAVSEELQFGKSPGTDAAFKDIVQYPKGSTLQYVTWSQAIENLKFYVYELRQAYFTMLQLPDWSYENMKTTPMSGEARKQLFIDCHLKVKDESGRLIEGFDREVNVVKSFLKLMLPDAYSNDIDALVVENEITPYTINDEKDDVNLLLMKNGNKPLMSQKESIVALGESEDPDKTMQEIQQESMANALEMSM